MIILYIYSTCWCMRLVFYECQLYAFYQIQLIIVLIMIQELATLFYLSGSIIACLPSPHCGFLSYFLVGSVPSFSTR
jgi:hypothetical protein